MEAVDVATTPSPTQTPIPTPTPTLLLEVVAAHGQHPMQHRIAGAGSSCTIGRALTCDVVLDDPYAAAEHTRLTLLDDGRVQIQDLGSANGTRIDGERFDGNMSATLEQGLLIVGRTHVRLRTLRAPLTPERVFRRDLLQRYRTTLALAGLALLLGYRGFEEWLSAPEHLSRDVFVTLLISVGLVSAWVALWSLLTRISHGFWALRPHVAIVSGAAGIAMWSGWLFGVAEFSTQWSGLGAAAGAIGGTAILGGLYLHLRKATHLSRRIAATVAIAIPAVLAAAWVATQDFGRDVNRMSRGPDVYPPSLRLTASVELDEFMKDVNALKRDANRKRQVSLADMPLSGPND